MPLLVFDDPDMELHEPGWGHPERPDRLRAARAAASSVPGLIWRRPKFASRDDLLRVHDRAYVDALLALHGETRQLDADTAVSPGSVRAALLAAGAVQDAVDAVIDGPDRRALCLVRPPGHHATADRAAGFCLLNNVVVGASRALRRGLGRIAILDWDVHHGDGTQALVQDHPGVLFVSLHEGFGAWPGTGSAEEVGPHGTLVNVPLREGAGHDEIVAAFDARVGPALERFAPELVLISAGFDAHAEDPLGTVAATEETFAELTRRVVAVAERHAGGRLVLVLEGGYFLPSLGRSLRACLEVLAQEPG